MSNNVVIVGAAETNEVGTLPGHSMMQLHVESAINALQDAGLTKADIDGVSTVGAPAGPGPIGVAHALGIQARWIDGTSVGGCSFLVHVRHAVAAIRAGYANTILVTHGESGRSRVGMAPRSQDPASLDGQFEMPYGVGGPPTRFTIPVLRFMKETGTTHEQLAQVAVRQRAWAAKNPRAKMHDLITVEDVFNSRMIAYPFHILECCLVTDGGGALVITTEERAKDMPQTKPLVTIAGTGESHESMIVSQMADFSSSKGFRESSKSAMHEADVRHEDIDHLMVYDAFAHLPLYGLEDIGFVGRGEAGAFVEDGNTAEGGRLPMNTNGGGLSYTHTGMYGMFAIQESVRQLRGEAAAQVPNVTTSMVQGVGGMFMAAANLVLTK